MKRKKCKLSGVALLPMIGLLSGCSNQQILNGLTKQKNVLAAPYQENIWNFLQLAVCGTYLYLRNNILFLGLLSFCGGLLLLKVGYKNAKRLTMHTILAFLVLIPALTILIISGMRVYIRMMQGGAG